jgi:hypothetical protein
MKPIEPGCLAVIIRSRAGNEGKVVRCLEYLGDIPAPNPYGCMDSKNHDHWLVDKMLNRVSYNTGKIHTRAPYASEHNLMRIDGYDEEEQVASKAVEVDDNA